MITIDTVFITTVMLFLSLPVLSALLTTILILFLKSIFVKL